MTLGEALAQLITWLTAFIQKILPKKYKLFFYSIMALIALLAISFVLHALIFQDEENKQLVVDIFKAKSFVISAILIVTFIAVVVTNVLLKKRKLLNGILSMVIAGCGIGLSLYLFFKPAPNMTIYLYALDDNRYDRIRLANILTRLNDEQDRFQVVLVETMDEDIPDTVKMTVTPQK